MARIKFKKGLQCKFLRDIKNESGFSWTKIAKKLNISNRTLTDWKREKYTISLDALQKLQNIAPRKKSSLNYKVLPDFWSIPKAARKGGLVLAKKYGGPGTPEGRKKGGKNSQKKRKLFPELYQNCNLRKVIKIPRTSLMLAEFIGIFLGDGGFNNFSQIAISFNKENGHDYFKKVCIIIKRLFGINPVVYSLSSPKKVIRLVVSSTNLVEFLVKNNRIKKGNKVKNQVDVPYWIKRNAGYSKSCLRGLIDTDGGVYYHRHSNGKWKSFNIGLCFSNKSEPLLEFVRKTLSDMQFHPRVSQSGDKVYLYREGEVLRYEKEVGFRNIHQTKRLKEYFKIKKRKSARAV